MEIPTDPALLQFMDAEDHSAMAETFNALAESGRNVTRLPSKPFDRKKVVEAFQEAFDLIGGTPRLAIWAHHNTTDFYKLYGKLIPSSAHIDMDGRMHLTITPPLPRSALDDDELPSGSGTDGVKHLPSGSGNGGSSSSRGGLGSGEYVDVPVQSDPASSHFSGTDD